MLALRFDTQDKDWDLDVAEVINRKLHQVVVALSGKKKPQPERPHKRLTIDADDDEPVYAEDIISNVGRGTAIESG